MIGLFAHLLTTDEAAELLDKLLSRAGATGARLAGDCTACGQPISSARPLGTLELGIMSNGHRILYPVCADCLTERETAPNAVGDRIEKQLATDFQEQARLDAEEPLSA